MTDASSEQRRPQMRVSRRPLWKMWAVFIPSFFCVFVFMALVSFYLGRTRLGSIHLWHAPIASLIGGYIGASLLGYLIVRATRDVVRRYPDGDPAAARLARETRLNLVFAVIFFATTLLLVPVLSGPREYGICCARGVGNAARAVAQCEVLQTRFFGPNSSFRILEQNVGGARTICAGGDGRGRMGCKVNLLLKSGPYSSYPVLSYVHFGDAEASTHQLNDYFNDPSRTFIILEHDNRPTLLLLGCGPMGIAGLALALRLWWRKRAA